MRRVDLDEGLAVEAEGLVKSFGATRAVDGLDLAVQSGSVYGFLGPNGAGKTTAMRILSTLIRPDAGSARVFGHDVVQDAAAVRKRIALTGQFASVDDDLTGRENLILLARLLGHSRTRSKARADGLLEVFGLTAAGGRLVKTYSGGMRRRLDIAASIVVPPDVLFLDEPTTGLDPQSRNQVWEIVRTIVADGATVLLTTQYLDEADQLADRIAVIDRGKLIAEGTSAELKASTGTSALRVLLRDSARTAQAARLLSKSLAVDVKLEPHRARLSAPISDPRCVGNALAELSASGIAIAELALEQPSLDEVFLALTGTAPDEREAA